MTIYKILDLVPKERDLSHSQEVFCRCRKAEKSAIFTVPTFVLLSHGKIELSIQEFTSFSVCKGTIFLAYYCQLFSTICNEIVYSLLEKRKSNDASFDFTDKKKIIMTKPFLLFLSFNFSLLFVYMSMTLR